MHGYIYITENLINGKKYIGQHRAKNTDDDRYLGSGSAIRHAIRKYGRNNFSRTILAIADTQDELNLLEIATIAEHDAVRNLLFYNIDRGGNGDFPRTIEYLQKIGRKTKQRWQEMSLEERVRMSEILNRARTPEYRARMSATKMGISNWTPEALQKYSVKRKEEVANGIRVPPIGNRGNKDFRHDEESRHQIKIGVRQARERVAAERGAYLSDEALAAMKEKVKLHYTPEVRQAHAELIKEGRAKKLAEYKEQGIEPPKFRWWHNPINPKQRVCISENESVPRGWIAGKGKTGGHKVNVALVHELIDAGLRNSEIAREVGCSPSHVWDIRKSKYADEIKSSRPNPYT